jgi:hypothetical protein
LDLLLLDSRFSIVALAISGLMAVIAGFAIALSTKFGKTWLAATTVDSVSRGATRI